MKICMVLAMVFAVSCTAQDNTVARVIFAEAANADHLEKKLVMSVILNRVGHIGFGRIESTRGVVLQSKAFSCVNGKGSTLWTISGNPSKIDGLNRDTWKECLDVAKMTVPLRTDIVYYHDHSIKKPSSWNNAYWNAIEVVRTKKFVFYRVEEQKHQ